MENALDLNLDLISVGIVAAGIGILGFTIYFSNRTSITNRAFLAFSLITIVWSIANYLQYQPSSPEIGLWIVRTIVFFGCWHAFTFFLLCYVFPKTEYSLPRIFWTVLLPAVAATSLITLTPFVFERVTATTEKGVVTQIQNGPGIILFGTLILALIGLGIYSLVRRVISSEGIERKQVALMSFGTFVTFMCIIAFNIVLPVAFNNARFLPLSALFIFPFIAATAYAIFRYKLLDVKVIATEIVAFFLSVATLSQVIFSTSTLELVLRSGIFGLVLSFSILLIRGVVKEVQQRELIEKQEKELELANREQESLLHFMSHEVKGYLTESQAGFAAIVEGDYGEVPEKIKTMAGRALANVRRGVVTIMEILDASNFKKGTVSYDKKTFDFRAAIREVVEQLKPDAAAKGLTIDLAIGEGKFDFVGDKEKLMRHVIRNLIDNAIKYTPSGTVKVTLADGKTIRFAVKDSGVGITPEDMRNLFTEGGRGKESIKVNVHSTGYGLYIAKKIVEAHGGRIWAESEGEGKGSQFTIEFPAKQ